MNEITYIGVWFITALVSWVIWLFVWKHFHKKHPYSWDKDFLWTVGVFGCLFGSGLWLATLPAVCLVGIGYLLYRLIIKD